MAIRKLTGTSIMLIASFSPLASYADASSAGRLEGILNRVESYSANFEQKIVDAAGILVSTADGRVSIARPNRFVWDTEKPDKIRVIADGRYLWNYDIDLAQVTKQDLAPVMQNSPAGILAGDTVKLTDSFHVSTADANRCQKGAEDCFCLEPKDPEATYSEVLLGIQQGKLVEIRMKDALGQDVQTRFKQVVINQPVSEKQFQFKPPKGVDVIYD